MSVNPAHPMPSDLSNTFCHGCGKALHSHTTYCPYCGALQFNEMCSPLIADQSPPESTKSRVTAGVLALLLGGLGFHKTYLGAYGAALIYLALCWTGIPMLVSFVEGARYLTLTDADFRAKASRNPGPFQFIW